MKKLLVSTSVIAALSLAGCGGETFEDLENETQVQTPVTRIVFDPANGDLNIPNDLLMLPSNGGVFDYTLNIPVTDPSDFSDPQNALNVLDGWSTNFPIQLNTVAPANVQIDESTLSAGIRIFEATLGLDQSDPDCAAIPVPSAGCKMGRELTFGVDYVLQLTDADTVTIVPLIPLKAAQGHMIVMTDALRDTSGKSVEGSTTWDLVKQDIATRPLASPSQLQLQTLVNTYIDALAQVGFTREELTYVSAFTTQSTTNVMSTIKQLQVSEFAQRFAAGDPTAGEALPAIVMTNAGAGVNALETIGAVSADAIADGVAQAVAATPALAPLADLIGATDFSSLQTCTGLFTAATGAFQNTGVSQIDGAINGLAQAVAEGTLAQAGALCTASVFEGTISLPYYSPIPRAENPLAPVNEFWDSACDSGIVLAGAGAALADATPGPNAALCQAVGLNDLRLNGEMVDAERRLTKFSPIPQMKGGNNGEETLDVQFTVPNIAAAAGLGVTLEMPENGWPVVMLVHGITSQKEAMLSISGALSLAGFATISIDQPIHGSRGFDLTGNGVDDLNATSANTLHFLNLASLPTARDNSRQAVADLLGVRLGLSAFVDATGTGMLNINPNDVSVMGVSLGAMTGGVFASLANTPFEGDLAPLSGMYAIKAASLESPGGGQGTFLLDSPSFGPLIKGSLLSQASPDFQAFLTSTFGSTDVTQAQLVQGTVGFLGALNAEQTAVINGIFGQFSFAAQTMSDSADPINFFTTLGENTPVHMLTVVGDGSPENLPDQVIPVTTALPLSGQLTLATLMGIDDVVSTVTSEMPIGGIVKYNSGAHGSSLNPGPSAAVIAEMQTQIATYLASGGTVIQVNNTDVIAN